MKLSKSLEDSKQKLKESEDTYEKILEEIKRKHIQELNIEKRKTLVYKVVSVILGIVVIGSGGALAYTLLIK